MSGGCLQRSTEKCLLLFHNDFKFLCRSNRNFSGTNATSRDADSCSRILNFFSFVRVELRVYGFTHHSARFSSLLEGSERRDKLLIALSEDFNVTQALAATAQRSARWFPRRSEQVQPCTAKTNFLFMFCLELSLIKEGMKKHTETSFGPR